MSLTDLFQTPAPDVAVEIDRNHIAAARLAWRGKQAVITAHATEPLAAGLVVPGLAALNIPDVPAVSQVLTRVLDQIGGNRSRVSLVVPDTVAKVSLLKLENVVLMPHRGGGTLETWADVTASVKESLDAFFAGRTVPHRVA